MPPNQERQPNDEVQSILEANAAANKIEFLATANELGVEPSELQAFEKFLHEPSEEVLPRLEQQAHHLVESAYQQFNQHEYPSPYYTHPPFFFLDKDNAVDATQLHLGSLEILNHPTRHQARKVVENKSYQPTIPDQIPLFEKAKDDITALAFADVALGLKPDPDPNKARTKRNPLLAGMWTKVGRHARIPWCGSSMPVCTGDPWAVATSAQTGMLVMIPRDAHYANVETQIWCFQQANELIEHPMFPVDDHLDMNEMINFHKQNIGVTIEPNPKKAYERTKLLFDAGCRVVRIYGPEGSTREMVDTLDVVRAAFGNEMEVFVGQVIDAEQALLLQAHGADGIYAGVGGGGICDTPKEASIAYLLLQTLYEFKRAGVSIPYIAEGGVGPNLPIVLALGGSAASKSDAIYGGTIESPGGFVYMNDNNGHYKPYAGEASAATKQLNGKLDRLGKPMFIEGIAGKAYYDPHFPSAAFRIYTLLQSLSTALVFARQRTVDGLRSRDQIPMWRNTIEGSYTRSTHH